MVKRLTILGATGSIGQSTLELVRQNPSKFSIDTLTAHDNVETLAALAREFNIKNAVIGNENHYKTLKNMLSGTKIEVSTSLCEAAARPVDIVIAAIMGIAGLKSVWSAINAGNTLALANKESLVAAGELVIRFAKEKCVRILPIDSEHNALFQALEGNSISEVEKLIITASGGPFRTWEKEKIALATPKQALKHPNWIMGQKITIDSASLMNKGLELIEAHHLFNIEPERLNVLVHPQSVIHGLVHFYDGSMLAQLGAPDMKIPISYCLAYPERLKSNSPPLSLLEVGKLTFEEADRDRFPCLALAEQAMRAGGRETCILNAANEVAVMQFLDGQIPFGGISLIVEKALELASLYVKPQTIEDVISLDAEVRAKIINS